MPLPVGPENEPPLVVTSPLPPMRGSMTMPAPPRLLSAGKTDDRRLPRMGEASPAAAGGRIGGLPEPELCAEALPMLKDERLGGATWALSAAAATLSEQAMDRPEAVESGLRRLMGELSCMGMGSGMLGWPEVPAVKGEEGAAGEPAAQGCADGKKVRPERERWRW